VTRISLSRPPQAARVSGRIPTMGLSAPRAAMSTGAEVGSAAATQWRSPELLSLIEICYVPPRGDWNAARGAQTFTDRCPGLVPLVPPWTARPILLRASGSYWDFLKLPRRSAGFFCFSYHAPWVPPIRRSP
jgi:hypothetical protein